MTKKILVVDDDPAIRAWLTMLLKRKGYQVKVAGDGLEALEMIGVTCPDLLITDLAMPFCDGIDLIRTLRSTMEYRGLPIILLSGSDFGNLMNPIHIGANIELRKPIHPESFLNCVESYLGEPLCEFIDRLAG